eukprot:gene12862-17139_t
MRALATGGFLAGWRGMAALACLSLTVLGVGGAARGSSNSGLLKVRLGGDQTETRIVLDLDRSVTGKLMADGSGGKVVVALPRIDTASDLSGAPARSPQSLRPHRGGRARRTDDEPALAGRTMKFRVPGEAEASEHPIPIRGISGDLPVQFAPEGGAVPGDRIVGILTPGEGITVYPIQSPELKEFDDQPERWLDVRWDIDPDDPVRFPARISLTSMKS